MGETERIVLCWLADDAAFGRVRSACATLRLRAMRISQNNAGKAEPSASVVLLVVDLESAEPWAALDIVHHLRASHPSRPLLAYFRRTQVTAGLVARLTRLSGVATWAQLANDPDDVRNLGRLMRGLLGQTPALVIRTLTSVLLHGVPGDRLWAFVDALLARIEQGEQGAPVVAEVAERARLKPWVLRRACRAVSAPTPERLTEWLMFIYVIALAESQRLSVARAAATVGVTEKYMRQLRASLVPEIPQLRGSLAHYALTHAIMRFAEECGMSEVQAVDVVRHVVAGGE